MTKQEAKKILGLPEEYNNQILKKTYKQLLHIYHPDSQNNISKDEKERKIRDIIMAYNTLLTSSNTYSLQDFLVCAKELKEEETIERQYKNFSLSKIPEELQIKIENNFQKFFNLSKTTQLKIYNLNQQTMSTTLFEYENSYYDIRSDLTYTFFNYLETHVQLQFSNKKNLYQKNTEEYCCGGVEAPIILDTLYEIVEKFLKYFDYFLREKRRLQKEIEKEVKTKLKKITEKYTNTENKELISEITKILNESLKEVENICQVSPLQEISLLKLESFLRKFEETLRNMCEGYTIFSEHKTTIVKLLEENIKSIPIELLDNDLKEELLSLYTIQEKSSFELKLYNIVEKIKNLSIEGKSESIIALKIEKKRK